MTTLLAPIMEAKPEQYVAFMVNNQTLMTTWHLFIYLVAGVCIVPLALALHARFENNKLAWTTIATAFGLIWAVTVISSGMLLVNNAKIIADFYKEDPTRAITIYQTLSAVERGLGGAIELPGGIWIFLVSWVALQAKQLPKLLNYLGLVIGFCGIMTSFPVLYNLGWVFGLGAILWFIGVGTALLREAPSATGQLRQDRQF